MKNGVWILGVRGSVPVSGPGFARYGGATSCVLVRLAGQFVLLDAGTGLLRLPEEALSEPALPLLLSHPHADHLLGLSLCPCVLRPEGPRLDIYARTRGGLDGAAQVRRLLSPPLWPVEPGELPCPPRFHELETGFDLGPVRVDALEGVHPGGVALLRLTGGGRRVVYAPDCVLTETMSAALADFARDCDLLLIDGQYSPEEWPNRYHFGHSSWRAAAELARACGAREARIVHHDPERTDEMLDAAAPELAELHPRCLFAREGEVIVL